MEKNSLEKLKIILNRANSQYDKGEITKAELRKVLFDVYYQYRKLTEDDDNFFPSLN